MNMILTSLMKKNMVKTDKNFAKILHQYLIQQYGCISEIFFKLSQCPSLFVTSQ